MSSTLINKLGKGLVLAHTALSIVALAWAAGVYFQFTDWGWKEPRADMGLRVPSEYDKRVATFREAAKAVASALPAVRPAQTALLEASERFAQNHVYYEQELARLRSSSEPLEVRQVKRPIALDTQGKVIGRPVFEEKIEGITKSYDSYRADLSSINQDIDKELKQIREWIEKEQKITLTLTGKDDQGKQVKNTVGIYGLLELEKKAQDAARLEKDYLQPIWAETIEKANQAGELRERLQATLDRLRGGKK